MTLRRGIGLSLNSIAAALIQRVGPKMVVDYARKLGIESDLDPVYPLALGSSDVSLYELVGAYSVFVNNGNYTKPQYIIRIENKQGEIIKSFNPEKREAISEELAWKMVHMLQGSTRERNGTALGLHRLGSTLAGNEVAAKTGTTSNFSDGWFVGCTKDLVTGIWVGGDERSIHFHSTNDGQGARLAMPIWSYYMDSVYANPETKITKGRFTKPASVLVELDCIKRKALMNDSLTIDNSETEINYDNIQ
jgi:penicillin-binding protein 1A